MFVIKNGFGEYLVFKSNHDGLRFHHELRFARQYRTGKGAKCAATRWRRVTGIPLQATQA